MADGYSSTVLYGYCMGTPVGKIQYIHMWADSVSDEQTAVFFIFFTMDEYESFGGSFRIQQKRTAQKENFERTKPVGKAEVDHMHSNTY